MEWILHWELDHINISIMLKAQKTVLVDKLKEYQIPEIEVQGKKD